MLCAKPFRSPSGVFGCGQCMPCRINRRRLWTARICLEAGCHDQSAFVTLTYDKEHNPVTLVPAHMRDFLKRLRVSYPRPLRFYGVGEYGDESWRPHYHLAIFGLSMYEHSVDFKTGFVKSGPVFDAWKMGGAHVGEVNPVSAHYIAGYVCKKMTAPDDSRLQRDFTLHPEFARMSLGRKKDGTGGIGMGALSRIADELMSSGGATAVARLQDVPHEVRINGKKYPLGRYLRQALREAIGWSKKTPDNVLFNAQVKSALMPDDERWALERRRAAQGRTAEARAKIARSNKTL